MRFSFLPSRPIRRGGLPSRRCFALVLLLILLLPGQSPAQSSLEQKKARAQRLHRQAVESYNRGDARKALSFWQTALRLYEAIGDRQGEGAMLGNLGVTYKNLGDYRRAIDYHERALKISREIGDRRSEGSDLGNLGNAYKSLGDYRRAIDYHERALKISREIGDRRSEGRDLGNLGSAYLSLSNYRRAIDYYKRALKIAREIGDRRGEGIRLGNLGNAYAYLGDYRRAMDYHGRALKVAREIGDRRGEGARLSNLGAVYLSLSNYHKAIDYHERALKISREIGDRRGEGQRLGNLGIAYSSLGDYRRAIDYHGGGLKIAREIGDREGEGTHLGNLGNAYSSLGDYRRAIDHYEQTLKITREIGDQGSEGIHLGNLGIAYANLSDYRRAIDYYKRALKIAREIGDRRGEGIGLGNLGIAHLLAGDTRKAGTYLEEASSLRKSIYRIAQGRPREAARLIDAGLEGAEKRGDSTVLFGSYVTLARAYEKLKESKKARHFYRKAADLVEGEREGLTDEQREFFFGAKLYFIYTRLTPYEGLVRLSKAEDAFEYAEAMKARRLLEQAARRESGRDPAVPDSLRMEEDEVTRELSALLKRKDSATKRNDRTDLQEIEAALKITRSKRTALIGRLYKEAPEYAAIRYPRPLKVEEVNLKPGEVLIEFALTDTTAHAFLLRGKRIVKAIRKDVGRAEVYKLVEAYRRQISEVSRLGEPDFDHTPGYRLFALLLKDLLPLVRKDEEVILVPDGKLALLPFEALPITPEKPVMMQGPYGYFPSGIAWLGERYRVRYEQSASALTQRRSLAKRSGRVRGETPTKGLFALADPVFGKDDPRFGRGPPAFAEGRLSPHFSPPTRRMDYRV